MPTINQKTLAIAVALAFPLPAAAVCVNPGGTAGCFASIQEAIDSAAFGDTVTVAPGTYYQGNIRMNQQVNLAGAGRDITVIDASLDNGDGTRRNSRDQVIHYSNDFNPRVTSTISGVTIRGGYRGVYAGRFNTVTLQGVRLTGNGPGSGAGAFINAERLIIRDSLVDHNFALEGLGCDWYWAGGGGGGIGSGCGGGVVQVYNSTITANRAYQLGGGVLLGGWDDVFENSTLSDNTVDASGDPGLGTAGGILAGFGRLSHSTIAGNNANGRHGGGILIGPEMTMVATVLQGNSDGDCIGPGPTSLGYNIASDTTCALSHSTDLAASDAALGALADNGGGLPTQVPGALSVAIDRVPAADCTLAADQRGVARPQGAGCDSGAVEATALEQLAALADSVEDVGPGHSLAAKLDAALAAAAGGKSCASLDAFMNEARAQSGRKIAADQASALIRAARRIASGLGC
jgi:hypothetical protein